MPISHLVFWLLVAHFACDFPLQGDTTAKEKSPFSTSPLQKIVPWYWWMTAHAFMHGGAVLLITGTLWMAIVEVCAHWVIDYEKVKNNISFKTDQVLHLLVKGLFVWAAL
jgi:hypothetical protein